VLSDVAAGAGIVTETIFIIDDDRSVRTSLSRLLRAEDFQTETFASASDYLGRGRCDGIGCILLDVNMPEISGIELQAQLVAEGHEFPIIFLTGHGDIQMSVQAMKRGALDFLTKPVDEVDLLRAVRQALEHHRSIQESANIREKIADRLASLTPRETEVLHQLIKGSLNKVVADRLQIALKTVKVHRAHLMRKMGVRSIAELVHLCHLVGVEPDPDRSTHR